MVMFGYVNDINESIILSYSEDRLLFWLFCTASFPSNCLSAFLKRFHKSEPLIRNFYPLPALTFFPYVWVEEIYWK